MGILDQMIRQIRGRVDSMVVRAAAKVISNASATQRLQLVVFDDQGEVEDNVEHMQPWGMSATPPNPGDLQAIGLALGGFRSSTVAILANSPSQRPTDGEEDSVGLWNSLGWLVLCKADGSVHLAAQGTTAAAKLPRDDRLQAELARLKSELDAFKAKFDAHAHAGLLGGTGSLAALTSPPTLSPTGTPVDPFPTPANPGATATDSVHGT